MKIIKQTHEILSISDDTLQQIVSIANEISNLNRQLIDLKDKHDNILKMEEPKWRNQNK